MSCHSDPDIELTVECVDGLALLQWNIQNKPTFGFDVNYSFNANLSGGTKVTIIWPLTHHRVS